MTKTFQALKKNNFIKNEKKNFVKYEKIHCTHNGNINLTWQLTQNYNQSITFYSDNNPSLVASRQTDDTLLFLLSGFLDAVLVYSQFTIYALFASIISLALVSERERGREYFSFNKSIHILPQIIIPRANELVCLRYVFFHYAWLHPIFFPLFFSQHRGSSVL